MSHPHVVESLSPAEFLNRHLGPGQPVVVRGALDGWPEPPPWHLEDLARKFGDHEVTLFDTLFALEEVATFAEYVDRHTGAAVQGVPPYLRWFTRQSDEQMMEADEAFAELAEDWTMPSWLPRGDYVFPPAEGPVDAARDRFPARGLFVCGRGGRTRLHVDPWASDACLCQVTGRKRFVMYAPGQGPLLSDAEGVVDLDAPDETRFPRWKEAVPTLDEVLAPGDAIFIPSGWYHTAVALDDSVSLTWNFTHRVHEERFAAHLRAGGGSDPVVAYFLNRDGAS
ncbi:cupin-like domain-containing protein [Streptomyces sp. JJ36]|uniref:cupin-like domain-containing protein n=1 Tax=Streptomyces sp. JJ36 TaxID=2736645 RepID=UPI001F1DA623|nr:cupin-like domain-containing protein [Streptomyces sp. JJ36]MCF6522527.1 cupin-like domain-containing protein [Streptomyces sp. JJ36]